MSKTINKDLLSKTCFSREFRISRAKLDAMIHADLLDVVEICGVDYLDISDYARIEEIVCGQHIGSGNNPGFRPKAQLPEDAFTKEYNKYHLPGGEFYEE